jgi:hypothetical protein
MSYRRAVDAERNQTSATCMAIVVMAQKLALRIQEHQTGVWGLTLPVLSRTCRLPSPTHAAQRLSPALDPVSHSTPGP